MIRRPPGSTRTDTLFPYTTLFRSKDISVGEVVRRTEKGFQLADCSGCALSPACGLTGVLAEGMRAMMAVFDSYTIADLLTDKDTMRRLINREAPLGIGML